MRHDFFYGFKEGESTNVEMHWISPNGEQWMRVNREPRHGDAEQINKALKTVLKPGKSHSRAYLDEINVIVIAPGTETGSKLGKAARKIAAKQRAVEDARREAAYKAVETMKAKVTAQTDGYGTVIVKPEVAAAQTELEARRKAAGAKAAATRRAKLAAQAVA